MEPWKQTITGVAYDLVRPTLDQVRSRDISHSLAFTCRYGGHVRHFYSTAEHSVLMARYFLDREREDLAREALGHDAHEYVTGDLSGPAKRLLPGYVTWENLHAYNVRRALGLNLSLDPRVKEADACILHDERAVLLPPPPRAWDVDVAHLPPLGVRLKCWTPLEARAEFDLLAQRLGMTVNGEPWEAW